MVFLRPDRIASVYLMHPLRRIVGRPTGVPVLMYHGISAGRGMEGKAAYFETRTSPERFATQMRFLKTNGFRAVSLETAICELESHGNQRTIAITFDDGYADFLEQAFPVLQDCGMTATVFLPTAYIGDKPRAFKSAVCLTWSQVRELSAAGICFGSHTRHHPQLRDVDVATMRNELFSSKAEIEDALGRPVRCFSYPYAFPATESTFVTRLRAALTECGYKGGVTTIIGTARPGMDPLFLPRLPVNDFDDAALFRAKLEGGYDWLRTVQRTSKWIAGRHNGVKHDG